MSSDRGEYGDPAEAAGLSDRAVRFARRVARRVWAFVCEVVAEKHFRVACIVLIVTALGWGSAKKLLGIVLRKSPVPWPANVVVDEDFRLALTSLPERLGPYALAADGTMNRGQKGEPDGEPDGFRTLPEDVLELLHIGTGVDQDRRGQRSSNWYASRVFVDTRPGRQFTHWELEVTYYTGGLDNVPHVPEVCLRAAGANLIDEECGRVSFSAPAARNPWDEALDFNRTVYEKRNYSGTIEKGVQYYIFSLNGRPERMWERVRLELTSPFGSYCYFAKIQFSPRQRITDVDQADEAAADFIRYVLPSVLQALPMPEDIQALNAAEK